MFVRTSVGLCMCAVYSLKNESCELHISTQHGTFGILSWGSLSPVQNLSDSSKDNCDPCPTSQPPRCGWHFLCRPWCCLPPSWRMSRAISCQNSNTAMRCRCRVAWQQGLQGVWTRCPLFWPVPLLTRDSGISSKATAAPLFPTCTLLVRALHSRR